MQMGFSSEGLRNKLTKVSSRILDQQWCQEITMNDLGGGGLRNGRSIVENSLPSLMVKICWEWNRGEEGVKCFGKSDSITSPPLRILQSSCKIKNATKQ